MICLDFSATDSNFLFGRLPLCELGRTLLASLHSTYVNNLEEQMTRPGVEDEDRSIDLLSC
jgi:hypothetical protein